MRNEKKQATRLPTLTIILIACCLAFVLIFSPSLFSMTSTEKSTEEKTPNTGSIANAQIHQERERTLEQPEKTTKPIKRAAGEIQYTDDGTPYIINPDLIERGINRAGDIRDVIPSIDDPVFVTAAEADFMNDDDYLIGVERNGEIKAYPEKILVWHEIVNDIVGGDPLVVTFCPLCMTGIVYERTVGGDILDFGTSGKLYNSNLVMYDRQTETYWSQSGGKAIIGELTGVQLVLVNADILLWKDWKKRHPDSLVLTTDTGAVRDYTVDPYEGYYTSDDIYFSVQETDDSLHPKDLVLGIKVNGITKAYPEKDLLRNSEFEDIIKGTTITVSVDQDRKTTFTNKETREIIPKERGFWFSWFAFNPETQLYEAE